MTTLLIVISMCLLTLGYIARIIRNELVKQQEQRILLYKKALEESLAKLAICRNNLDNAVAEKQECSAMLGKLKKHCNLSCFMNAEKEEQ